MTNAIALVAGGELAIAGQAANHHAAQHIFLDYRQRKAANTLESQGYDLAAFSAYLVDCGLSQAPSATSLSTDPNAWLGMTWGIVQGFSQWMLNEGYAIASINRALSTVRTYAGLAVKAGAISAQEAHLITAVRGFSRAEADHLNETRETSRLGLKKAEAVELTTDQARALKGPHEGCSQCRRDTVIMCLLLDHGLRVGEVAQLRVENINLEAGQMRFKRPKVAKEQRNNLSDDTKAALIVWYESGDAPSRGPLLGGIKERTIQRRVETRGQALGIESLSPHDLRHYWATYWATRVDPFTLQQAGGWNSLSTAQRYVQASEIANAGLERGTTNETTA